jgi:hypothetical protein
MDCILPFIGVAMEGILLLMILTYLLPWFSWMVIIAFDILEIL